MYAHDWENDKFILDRGLTSQFQQDRLHDQENRAGSGLNLNTSGGGRLKNKERQMRDREIRTDKSYFGEEGREGSRREKSSLKREREREREKAMKDYSKVSAKLNLVTCDCRDARLKRRSGIKASRRRLHQVMNERG